MALGLRDQIAPLGTGAFYDKLDRKADVAVVGASQNQDILNMQRARDRGMHVVPSLSRTESTPLGRAEWLKALAAVFNLESRANDVYGALSAHYQLVSLRARAAAHRPRVFWGSTDAAGEWTVARNSSQARLIEDAGAVNPLADQGPTVMVKSGPALIVERAGDAEYWITENGSILHDASNATVLGTTLGALQAVRARHVYNVCRAMRVEKQRLRLSSDRHVPSGPGARRPRLAASSRARVRSPAPISRPAVASTMTMSTYTARL